MNIKQTSQLLENTKKILKILLVLTVFYSIFLLISNLRKTNNNDFDTQSYTSSQRLEAIKKLGKIKENDYVLGNVHADINLILYSNYQCQYSLDVYQRLKQLLNEYQDEITVAVRHLPSTDLESLSSQKARMIDCISEIKGKNIFWNYHEQFFSSKNISDITFKKTNLEEKVNNCLDHSQEKHQQYFRYLNEAEIKSTPVIIISSSTVLDLLIGNQSISNLRLAIEKQL